MVVRKQRKVGVSAVPFYDGLVEIAMFSPVVDCRNKVCASNTEEVQAYLFLNKQ